jgi:RHS repeat-associated protein
MPNLPVARHVATWFLIILTLATSQAGAQTAKTISEEYDNAIKGAQTITAFGPDLFGEGVNLKDGTTSFSATDISVRTNSGLPMTIGRSYGVNARDIDQYVNAAADGELFGNWKLDVPYMSGTFDERTGWVSSNTSNPQLRCSSASPPPAVASAFAGWGISYYPEQYWRGNQVNIPGKGSYPLLALPAQRTRPADGRTYYWTTKSNWRIACVPLANGAGEGFLVILPDGTKYTFDWISSRKVAAVKDTQCRQAFSNDYTANNLPSQWVLERYFGPPGPNVITNQYGDRYRYVFEGGGGSVGGGSSEVTVCREEIVVNRREYFLHVTKVEDRFGNWIAYNYDHANPRRLNSITSKDGATISVNYGTHGKISSISTGSRTWQYQYGSTDGGLLSAVVQPDSSRWTFQYENLYQLLHHANQKILWSDCEPHVPGIANASLTIGHPSGAQGVFSFKNMMHGMDRVPGGCNLPNPDRPLQVELSLTPMVYKAASLITKQVSGPGLSAQTWSYAYTPSWSWNPDGYVDDCTHSYANCNSTVSTDVTGPDGIITRSTFGNDYYRTSGQLLRVETIKDGVTLQSTVNTYLPDAVGQAFPDSVGIDPNSRNNRLETEYLRPLRTTSITRDGATFTSEVIPCSGASYCFDSYARPTAVKKSNTLGYSRIDVTDYHDDLGVWVLGQIKRQYNANTNIVMAQTEFNPQALPWKTHSFGKLQSTLTYNSDGTLASIADGRGNTTLVSVWKRGIPQRIQYPATSESPTGATETAVVDDNGWIASTTDENNYTTGYAYDAMGRLAGIGYPTGDTIPWTSKSFEFRALTASDWLPPGISIGQWRHYEGQGNAAKFTYFDAQWRPVLVQEYDTGNAAATLRYTRTDYDSNGRVSFQSYPVSDPATATTGARTFYDPLNRVIKVEQDSELSILTTTTTYLAGLQARVTNPRGLQTTTSFMAWDEPSYDLPIQSVQPEGKVIDITRDAYFGWPKQLRQRSADNNLQVSRDYVYDGNAQLCKTIEPETGATVMHYDAAGNLDWSAAGLNLPSTTACDETNAGIAARKVMRSYDARNRLATLAFPDGRGDQVWTYTPDGLPENIVTYNGAGQTQPVVNAYQYNKRRMLNGQGEYLSQPGWYVWGTGYGYNGNGQLVNQRYPTGLIVDYAPNALGQSTQAGTFASGAQYYPNGALKQFSYGNGIVHTMTQNARQLPARSLDSGNVVDFTYTYDANANPTAIVDGVTGTPTTRSRWMTYDGLDRLTTAASAVFGGNDHTHRFGYDALDNLKSWKLAGVKDYADYIYDSQNRLTTIRNTAGTNVVSLGYDAQGNLASKNDQSYDFDYGNRLKNVPGKEWYQYDGLGRRVKTGKADGRVVLWIYSQSGQMLYDEDGTTLLASEHVYLAGSLIATRQRNWSTNVNQTKYQHTDALGSPVAVTNEAGSVIERNDYEPYGAIIGKPNKSGIGYTGHVMDGDTGLTYMQQRYYDQSIGRFLSVDPVTANSSTGANFNRYMYANNNPYRFVDQDGRLPKELKRQGYEEIGDGYVVRVDSVNGPGGQSFFEVHVYRDSKDFVKAALARDKDGLRDVEVNTLKTNGVWGKHGKPSSQAPDLGDKGQAGFNKVIVREMSNRNWIEKSQSGRLQLREQFRKNLVNYSRYLGAAGAIIQYGTSSTMDHCERSVIPEIC